jgi:hypothetical protein
MSASKKQPLRQRGPATIAVVAGLVLSACSGGGADPSSDPTVEGTGDSTDEPSSDESSDTPATSDGGLAGSIDFGPLSTPIPGVEPVSMFTSDGDEINEVEQTLLPSDLLEVVRRGVAAGSFSEAEGIARALNGLSGLGVPTPGLGPDDVIEAGLTALTRHAADLMRGDGLDDDERTLLANALRPFTPSQELLDAISAPAPGPTAGFANASFARSAASASPIEIISLDCFDVIATGVSSDTDLETGEECFYYVEAMVDGNQLRVYYSSTWQTDPDQLAIVDVALDGLVTSVGVYGGLATVGDVNAVFSLGDSADALAQQSYVAPGETCPITLFTSASAEPLDVFKQTIAHEVFHCVQDWSFTTEPYETHSWWMEGSAEYFSNVVYPTVNDEHQWQPTWDSNSLNKNLTEMEYENTVFFQYHANVRGEVATVDLLRDVSAGGATVDVIASMPGMEQVWRDFVVATMADAVYDTGGGTVGPAPGLIRIIVVDHVQSVELETSPMRAARYGIRYAKGKRYEQTTDESSHVAVAWVNDVSDLSAWTEMPVEVRPTCEKFRTYVAAVTTVGETPTPTANVGTVEQAVCDPCLLGTWGLQLRTFADYILSVVRSGGGQVDGLTVLIDGDYTFEFEANGALSADKNITVQALLKDVGVAPATKVTGSESGRYDADGGKLTVTGWQGDSTASIGNTSSSVFSGPEGQASDYTCEDGMLTLTSLPYGPLVFDLLNPPPEPPPIIIDTGL